MTTLSSNLSLKLYNSSSDQSGSFLTWTQDMSGSSNSNMTKIDDWAGGASGSVTNLSSSFSGSITDVDNLISSLSGSIADINSNISGLQARMAKLDEYSGAGTLDFNNIPQTYDHLLIMGVAKTNIAQYSVDLGIDFNGDANSSNYIAVQWIKTYSSEFFESLSRGAIIVGNICGSVSTNYPGLFLALVPNYSSGSSIYKTAMGISINPNTGTSTLSIQGGTWLGTDAITRVRMFGVYASSYRYSFLSGTKISIYGFGG